MEYVELKNSGVMKTKIVDKDISVFKLTVTNDKSRVEIKVPTAYKGDDKEEIIEFLKSVAEQVNYPYSTLRGSYSLAHKKIRMQVVGKRGKYTKYVFLKMGGVAQKVLDRSGELTGLKKKDIDKILATGHYPFENL